MPVPAGSDEKPLTVIVLWVLALAVPALAQDQRATRTRSLVSTLFCAAGVFWSVWLPASSRDGRGMPG
jgi:hypothetical protein